MTDQQWAPTPRRANGDPLDPTAPGDTCPTCGVPDLDQIRRILADDAQRQIADIERARDELNPPPPEDYDPTKHRCPLCCPPSGHATVEVPYWLETSDMVPAHWRFVYHVIIDIRNANPTRQERLDAAAMFAHVYGDRALARAINEAKACTMPHPKTWDPMWDGLLLKLHREHREWNVGRGQRA